MNQSVTKKKPLMPSIELIRKYTSKKLKANEL